MNSANIFITFGAGRTGWLKAAKRITSEARDTRLFLNCFNLGQSWLQSWDSEIYAIAQNLRKKFGPRGFGYWTWKPSVLYWADKYFPNHQIVYVDAGSEFTLSKLEKNPLHTFLLKSQLHGGLAWQLEHHPEKSWTKKELLRQFEGSNIVTSSNQIQSGFISLPPSKERSNFVNDWRNLALAQNGFFFTDELTTNQESKFVEHRHDQSAFSCLWKLYGFPYLTTNDYQIYCNDFGIIATRNNSLFSSQDSTLRRKIDIATSLSLDLLLGKK